MSEMLDGNCLVCGALQIDGKCSDLGCWTHERAALKAKLEEAVGLLEGWRDAGCGFLRSLGFDTSEYAPLAQEFLARRPTGGRR